MKVNHQLGIKTWICGAPGWLSQLSVWLQLRSWSHSSCVRAPHRALCSSSEPGAASDSVSPSLSAPPPLMPCLSLCLKNKWTLKKRSWIAKSRHIYTHWQMKFFVIYFVNNKCQWGILNLISSHHFTNLLPWVTIPTSNDRLAHIHIHDIDPSILLHHKSCKVYVFTLISI